MAVFKVLVEETLSRYVEVTADDEFDATSKVIEMYNEQKIVLDSSDLSDVFIREQSMV